MSMDKYFKIIYEDANESYLTTANSQDEADMIAAQLFDEGYRNIKIEGVRV